jgi:WD40 repeat protein
MSAGSTKLMPVLALGVLCAGAGLIAVAGAETCRAGSVSDRSLDPQSPVARAPGAPADDRFGDPLPDGALARLGSVRLRHADLSDFTVLPDGQTAVTVGQDGVVRTWDLTTGREARAAPLQGARRDGPITVSADGKIATAATAGKITVWDTHSGREVKTLSAPDKGPAFLGLSPDGGTVAVGLRGPLSVLLVEWRTGQERRLPLPPNPSGQDSNFHARFSPDGKWLVAGGEWRGTLCVFEAGTGREVHRFSDARSAVITPDGQTVAVLRPRQDDTASDLRLFDMASGRETASFPVNGSYDRLTVSPDGKTVACGRSGRGCLVDLATGRVLHQIPGVPWDMAFTPDAKTLIVRSANALRLWDVATGTERLQRPPALGPELVAAFSPDGRLLATADQMDKTIAFWDLNDGRLARSLPLGGEDQSVRDLTFSPDGQTLSAARYKGLFQFWEVATGREQRSIQLRDPSIPRADSLWFFRLQVSPDGGRVTTLETNMTLKADRWLVIWNGTTGLPTGQLSLPLDVIHATTWIWASDEAVVVPHWGGLTVYDGEKLRPRYRLTLTNGSPRSPVAASPSGRLLAARTTANAADAVGVWDLDTGRPVATLSTGPVDHLALAADDRTCVTAGGGALRVWDLATGRERGRRPLPSATYALLFAPDGRRSVTALSDGTGLVWDLAPFPSEPLARSAGAKEIGGWWTDLASDDAPTAHTAVWRLADAPAGVVVPLLAQNLRPIAPDSEAVRRAVADLDDAAFTTREEATKRLERMGGAVVPALRQALAATDSPEVRRRLEGVIERLTSLATTPDALRRLRVIGVLERLGTADAQKLLADLAAGAIHPQEVRAARAALDRLDRRAAR